MKNRMIVIKKKWNGLFNQRTAYITWENEVQDIWNYPYLYNAKNGKKVEFRVW